MTLQCMFINNTHVHTDAHTHTHTQTHIHTYKHALTKCTNPRQLWGGIVMTSLMKKRKPFRQTFMSLVFFSINNCDKVF